MRAAMPHQTDQPFPFRQQARCPFNGGLHRRLTSPKTDLGIKKSACRLIFKPQALSFY
jgi:hypothetical protein